MQNFRDKQKGKLEMLQNNNYREATTIKIIRT